MPSASEGVPPTHLAMDAAAVPLGPPPCSPCKPPLFEEIYRYLLDKCSTAAFLHDRTLELFVLLVN